MATHRRGSAEANAPGTKVPRVATETTHGEHTAIEAVKTEPTGLPAFGANPVTVPSIAALVAVSPPVVEAVDVSPPVAAVEVDLPVVEAVEVPPPVVEAVDVDPPVVVEAVEVHPPVVEAVEVDPPVVDAAPLVVPADEEVSAPHPAHGRNELGLDADIAAHWDLWSAQIGRALMPTLRELGRSMQGFSCAMICTADGFNLCTLGVDESGVLRLAALTSSMHSMADAVTQAVHGDTERRLDVLTLTDQTSTIVVLAIRDLIIGKLLLWVATEDETLGALLVRSRLAAAQVRQLLHVDES